MRNVVGADSAKYWQTFESNARAILSGDAPAHWHLAHLEASEGHMSVTFTWADDHLLTFTVNAPSENDALEELRGLLTGARRQTER